MNGDTMHSLAPEVERCLQIFADAAKKSFGSDLSAIVLFGSAATGDMRALPTVCANRCG
jgi:hypothetical protein